MRKTNTSPSIAKMARMSLLIAIVILLTFTPLGYIVIGPIAATTIQMPVIIGAALMGPAAGATLGAIFGLSAIAKILMMPGADVFATTIMNYNFFLYAFIAIAPRLLMGWLSGLLILLLKKVEPLHRLGKGAGSFAVAGFIGSMMNTVFYLGALWMFASQIVADFYQMDVSGVGTMVMGVAYSAGVPEAIVSALVVGAVCRAMGVIDKT